MGGAIFNAFGTLILTNDTLSGNTAQGGIGDGSISGSIGGDGGAGFGGGLFNLNGTVTMTYVTVAGNKASGGSGGTPSGGTPGHLGTADGLGVYNMANALAPNTTPSKGVTADMTIYNSIIGQNTIGQTLSAGFNFTNDATDNGVPNTAHITGSTNLVQSSAMHNGNGQTILDTGVLLNNFSSPNLQPLANNGGPTETMAVTAGSPPQGAASGSIAGLPQVDQRGLPRSAPLDVGAFQTQHPNNGGGGGSSSSSFDSSRVSGDAFLTALGFASGNFFFAFLGLSDFNSYVGTLDSSAAAAAQNLFNQNFVTFLFLFG
jgi:hypothetical protein